MRAAFHRAKKKIIVEQAVQPVPGSGEYLVRIKACSICGSDTWWDKEPDTEFIHGHESAGIVEACGIGTSKFKTGDKVVCYAIKGCGECAYCRRGTPTNCQSKIFVQGGLFETQMNSSLSGLILYLCLNFSLPSVSM